MIEQTVEEVIPLFGTSAACPALGAAAATITGAAARRRGRRRLMEERSAQMVRTLAALGPLGPCSSSYSTFAPSSSDL